MAFSSVRPHIITRYCVFAIVFLSIIHKTLLLAQCPQLLLIGYCKIKEKNAHYYSIESVWIKKYSKVLLPPTTCFLTTYLPTCLLDNVRYLRGISDYHIDSKF